MTLDELIAIVANATGVVVHPSDANHMTLGGLDLDSLDLASVSLSVDDACGRPVDFLASDGAIRLEWTLTEFHHFINAFLERNTR